GGLRPVLLGRPPRRGPGRGGHLLREHRAATGGGVRLRPGLRAGLSSGLPADRPAATGAALDAGAEALAATAPWTVRGVQPGLRPGHALRPADEGAGGEHPRLDASGGSVGVRPPARTGERGGATRGSATDPARVGLRRYPPRFWMWGRRAAGVGNEWPSGASQGEP